VRIFGGHDGGSGCAYYRMLAPLGELAAHGHDVVFGDAGDDGHPHTLTLKDLLGYDVVIAQRWNKHEGLQVWRRARTPASRLVFELDDDLWSVTPENWVAYQLYQRPDIRDAVEHAAAVADLITVTTEPLAEVLREVSGNDRVAVLPNCVPAWALELPREEHPRPRIGWTGGASHGVDIGLIAEPARRFLKRFPGWDFVSGGTDYRDTIRAPADRMSYTDWVKVCDDPEGFYRAIDYDIGLAPLHETVFARSKSGIKVLEYAARGIPAIASDCEAYRPVIEHGVTGFLVKRDHEWLSYMSELAADPVLRAKMGEAARDLVRGRFLIGNRWPEWDAAYRNLF
jgi:glycosyltransferase involved in cell wall biosynthesis